MSRKLVSIQKITIEPIKGADKVELGKVLGWTTIVRKGEFKTDDKCCFFEIDSLLPDKPEYDFMREKKFRVRTMKSPRLGVISQGLALPLNVVGLKEDTPLDSDVTEQLGVIKYEPPIPLCLMGKIKGMFPTLIPKTDETRVQVLQNVLTKYKGMNCYITEKIDGTSTTFYVINGEFGVCGRNYDFYEEAENAYWQMANELKIKEKLLSIGKDIAIQGELVGPKIQNNPLQLKTKNIYFFNAWNVKESRYYSYKELKELLNKLELKMVPVLKEDYLLEDDIPKLVELAKGNSVITSTVKREGIVIRPLEDKMDYLMTTTGTMGSNGRVSFKSINVDYLIEVEE